MKQPTEDLKTILDFVRWGASRFNTAELFFGHGTDNATDEAIWLVCHTLHLDAPIPEEFFGARLTADEKNAIAELFERRINEHLPAAYLTNSARFMGLEFYVDERVLIPRSPLAELIEQRFEPWIDPDHVNRIVDMCTGRGCIAIACAYAFPEAQIDAVDLSDGALDVAHINIERHGLANVAAHQSDLFERLPAAQYDIIVSNPPYVDDQEVAELRQEYRHEPAVGLAAGPDGLDIVLRLLRHAPAFLGEDGVLVVEVGAAREALEERCLHVPFTWLEFEHGGEGVFLLRANDLKDSVSQIDAA